MPQNSKKLNLSIGILGLGYVGLPLAIEFGKYFRVFGYDINLERIKSLQNKIDINKEISKKDFMISKTIFTNNYMLLKECNIYIITVPTPILKNKNPDLSLIKKATKTISKIINKKNIIILESTVYPGVTEDLIGKYISNKLKFKLNKDFFLGYSPERINPGDKKNTLVNIKKIISASNVSSLKIINAIYSKIIKKGVIKVENIKIAEAAKVIENTQRDINIAVMNEFENIFDRMKINSKKVFEAAYTKWNFLKFKPGLVGGHCIGIDPYYLIYASKKHNYNPKLLNYTRNINDQVPNQIFIKIKNKSKNLPKNIKKNCLILGATFKENCPDIRNSKIYEIFKIFKQNKYNVSIYDPVASSLELKSIYKKNIVSKIKLKYDIILLLVPHDIFIKTGHKNLIKFLKKDGLFFDYKYIFSKNQFSKLL